MLTNTREQPSGPPVCLDTHEVARPRPGLLVGNVPVSPTSPAGVTTARVWVLAWVSTPMTKSKLSATTAMRHRPPSSRFGVVTASAREEAVVGRNCKGSPPGDYRAGHASDQATATRPGPAPVPTTSTCGHIPTKDTSWPRVSQFSGHAHPRSRDQHRSCQPAPGQPPPHLQSVFTRRRHVGELLGKFSEISTDKSTIRENLAPGKLRVMSRMLHPSMSAHNCDCRLPECSQTDLRSRPYDTASRPGSSSGQACVAFRRPQQSAPPCPQHLGLARRNGICRSSSIRSYFPAGTR